MCGWDRFGGFMRFCPFHNDGQLRIVALMLGNGELFGDKECDDHYLRFRGDSGTPADSKVDHHVLRVYGYGGDDNRHLVFSSDT